MAEIRRDPLTGRAVILAPERAQRPRQLGVATVDTDRTQPCPFCPGNEHLTPPESWSNRPPDSTPDHAGWSVRVVPNKYPAVTGAAGVHEVIIESAAHVTNLAVLNAEQITRIFQAYRERLRFWRADRRWRYAMIFKNQGERAGATFEHAHAQLVALPFVPADVANEISRAREYHQHGQQCYGCALIERELQAQARMIIRNQAFIALCPSAPRFAFETWIVPRIHAAAFEQATDSMIADLAEISRQMIVALDRLQPNPPFNYYIQSPALNERDSARYHWQLRILPQFYRAAGFEWGSGMHINPVTPEDAARALRDALV